MINVPDGYEDAHGIVYTGAVVVINHVSHSSNQHTQLNLEITETGPQYVNTSQQSHSQIGFTALIYPSLAALQERKPPLTFRPNNFPEYFNMQLQQPLAESEMVSACEQWLLTNVLATE
jgi:hypothetical protein